MKIKPIHLLAGLWWLNTVALQWCILFDVIESGLRFGSASVMSLALAVLASMSAFEKGKQREDE